MEPLLLIHDDRGTPCIDVSSQSTGQVRELLAYEET